MSEGTMVVVAEIRRLCDALNSLIDKATEDGLLVELNVTTHMSVTTSDGAVMAAPFKRSLPVLEIQIMRRLL